MTRYTGQRDDARTAFKGDPASGDLTGSYAGAAKHTPGPWTAERVYYTRPNPDMKIMGGGIEVATATYSDDESHTYCTTDVDVMRANARLIAAAPKMLEALRQAERWIVQQMLDNGCPAERLEHPPAGSHLFNIRAAIAAATGEAA